MARAASPFSSIYRRTTSPLKLELQKTMDHMQIETAEHQASSVLSPMLGAEQFFAASGRSLETDGVIVSGKMEMNIQDRPRTKNETPSSMGYGRADPPDTTVFSFLGPDEEVSHAEKQKLSSLLS